MKKKMDDILFINHNHLSDINFYRHVETISSRLVRDTGYVSCFERRHRRIHLHSGNRVECYTVCTRFDFALHSIEDVKVCLTDGEPLYIP